MRVTPYDSLRLGVLAVAISLTDGRAAEPPAPVVADPRPPRLISTDVISAVAGRLPGFNPFFEQPARPDAADIFYLPTVTVTKTKLPPISAFEFLTPKARLEVALKTHPGLGLVPLPKLNNQVAAEMQKQEREAEKRSAVTEQILSISVIDDAKTREEINLMRAATAQPNNDWRDRFPGR